MKRTFNRETSCEQATQMSNDGEVYDQFFPGLFERRVNELRHFSRALSLESHEDCVFSNLALRSPYSNAGLTSLKPSPRQSVSDMSAILYKKSEARHETVKRLEDLFCKAPSPDFFVVNHS